VKLPLPERMDFRGMVDGRVIIKTSEDWTAGGSTIPAGALVSVDRAQFNGGPMTPTVLFQPTARQSLDAAVATKTRVVAFVLDNVRSRVMTFTPGAKGWTSSPVTLPTTRRSTRSPRPTGVTTCTST
jgi:prolyl oligopeptidase